MLSDIQERIERSIFHALLSVCVSEGYTPDITLFDVENANLIIAQAEQAAYDVALANIRTLKGFAIEVFNNSNSQQRGTKKVPRIVLETMSFFQGELGVDTSYEYVPDGLGGFNVVQPDSQLTDLHFGIRLVAQTTKQIRILHAIMLDSIPRRGYIKWYDQAQFLGSDNIHIRYLSSSDYSWVDEGIVEKVYRYEVKDIHEPNPKDIKTVPGITEIDVPIEYNGAVIDEINLTIPQP